MTRGRGPTNQITAGTRYAISEAQPERNAIANRAGAVFADCARRAAGSCLLVLLIFGGSRVDGASEECRSVADAALSGRSGPVGWPGVARAGGWRGAGIVDVCETCLDETCRSQVKTGEEMRLARWPKIFTSPLQPYRGARCYPER